MSVARFLHRRVLLPAFESGFKHRRVFRYWDGLERTQWMEPGAIADLQFRALGRIVRHTYGECPPYRELWDRFGVDPSRLDGPREFARWPVIDREFIREHRMALRTGNRLIAKSTGGSSGVPLQFDLDPDSNDRRTAAWHRGYAWAGAAPGTKQLYLWGVAPGRGLCARAKDALYNGLYRRRIVSCFGMDDDFAATFAATLDYERPDAVVAYTNALYEVATRLEQLGRAPAFSPRAMVVGAEQLHAFQRERIERVFRATVFETYGSREFMLIGAECERHCGLHLTSEQLLVEVLDDDGRPTPAGQEGNIVITDLYNYGMPFIRYANGDRAIAGFEMCGCGRGLPLLKQVMGRQLDVLRSADGRAIPGEFFPHLVKDFDAVRRFQVVQEEPGRVRFRLVADGMSADDRGRLEMRVRQALGAGMRIDFERVSEIPLSAAGKLQVVVNRVKRAA